MSVITDLSEGTCKALIDLNDNWENYPAQVPHLEYEDERFGKVSGITMMSMLFCKHGGLITPVTSGQENTKENFWTEEELHILEQFGDIYAYENWTEKQKRCAEEIWQRFYVEYGYEAYFVAGIIGNMYGEGVYGMLEDKKGWKGGLIGGNAINNSSEAYLACIDTKSDFGVGMLQWSYFSRKELLFENYELFKSEDGALTADQLIEAELKTIKDEFDRANDKYYLTYQSMVAVAEEKGDCLGYATNIIFRDYELPGEIDHVIEGIYEISDEAWKEAEEAVRESDSNKVPSIYRRNIGAKMAYEYYMGEL